MIRCAPLAIELKLATGTIAIGPTTRMHAYVHASNPLPRRLGLRARGASTQT